jgi:hypothetical protein
LNIKAEDFMMFMLCVSEYLILNFGVITSDILSVQSYAGHWK